jgi:hypothetical protein
MTAFHVFRSIELSGEQPPSSGVNRGDDRYHAPLEVHKMTLFKSNLSRNLTSPNPQQDRVFRSSFAGMAHFADTGPAGRTCRECQFWQHTSYDYHSKAGKYHGLIKPSACAKYKAITGRVGAPVPDDAMACKYFEFNCDLRKRFA